VRRITKAIVLKGHLDVNVPQTSQKEKERKKKKKESSTIPLLTFHF